MSSVGFDEVATVRFKGTVLQDAKVILNDYKRRHNGKYENFSHYVRVAVNKLNREEKELIGKKR